MGPKTIVAAFVKKNPRCPGCHREVGAFSGDAMPEAGDWNVCDRCFVVGRFTGEGFELRAATADEIEAALAAGDLDAVNADFLRQCYAAHAARGGVRS